MREYSFRKDGFTFERVSKATARINAECKPI